MEHDVMWWWLHASTDAPEPAAPGAQKTYRRLDVGAEATDARAESPGSEAVNELDAKPGLLALSRLSGPGNTLANCDDDNEGLGLGWPADGSWDCEGDGGRNAGSMGDALKRMEATVEVGCACLSRSLYLHGVPVHPHSEGPE